MKEVTIQELDENIYKEQSDDEFLAYYEEMKKRPISRDVIDSAQYSIIFDMRCGILLDKREAGEDITRYLEKDEL